jgi:hypothetical protein
MKHLQFQTPQALASFRQSMNARKIKVDIVNLTLSCDCSDVDIDLATKSFGATIIIKPHIVLIRADGQNQFDSINLFLSSITSPIRYSDNHSNKIESYLTEKQKAWLLIKMPTLSIENV